MRTVFLMKVYQFTVTCITQFFFTPVLAAAPYSLGTVISFDASVHHLTKYPNTCPVVVACTVGVAEANVHTQPTVATNCR